MGYRSYNPNPKNARTGDCAVRALSLALDQDWDSTYTALMLKGYQLKDLPDANAVWGAVLRENGWHRAIVPDTCPDCYTVSDFCQDHPTGTYVLAIRGHALTVRDGNWFDTWDSGQEAPLYYWYKEDVNAK